MCFRDILSTVQDDLPYFLGFSQFPGIGPVRFALLYKYFGSAKSAWNAPVSTLKKIKLGEKLSDEFDRFRKNTDLDAYVGLLDTLHIRAITIFDPKYPRLLKQIPDAPFLLYVRGTRGKYPINLERTVAVVGTRSISHYGVEVTQKIVSDLVTAGCTIVSGMAYGVDAVAHKCALDAGGTTIAVLGCGVDVIAPPTNTNLYWEIIHSGRGAVISEMPLGLRPNKGLFPARNRIISGLCRGVVVTEGAEDSGALITASRAAEQGREVFAVPGPITSPTSRGPAKLLKSGAKLVESAADVLDELNITFMSSPTAQKLVRGDTKEEQRILTIIASQRQHIDAIVRESGLTVDRVAAILTVLEIKGIAKDYGDKIYGLV